MKNGWQQTTLRDLCVVDWGNTNLTKAAYVEGGEFLAVSAAGCDGRIGHKEHSKYTPVLSAIGAQCGKMFFPDEDFTAIKNTITLTPRDGRCIGRFLYYLLTFVKLPQRGAGQPFISKGDIQSFSVTVPPLSEQRRIVGILDEAFDGIATVKTNTEKNLQNARALFESHVQSVFTQRGEGWIERPLKDCVADILTGPFGSILHKSDYQHGGIPLVNPINIVGDEIVPDDRKAVGKATALRLARYALRENDIVIGRRGEIGRCAVVTGDQCGWLCGTGCFVIRPSDKTDPHFLTHLLRSRPYRGKLEGMATRATMPSVSNDDLTNLVIRLPPVPQQRRMLTLIEELSSETQRLESIYERKLVMLDELNKSSLHQAFAGQLGAQAA
jgi:type I restriction enzyme S subunit